MMGSFLGVYTCKRHSRCIDPCAEIHSGAYLCGHREHRGRDQGVLLGLHVKWCFDSGVLAFRFIGDKYGPSNLMNPLMTATGSLSFGKSTEYM